MSSPELDSNLDAITRPIFCEPDAFVVNIFPEPGTEDVPDLESQRTMEQYLISRLQPDDGPRTRVVLTPTGYDAPGIKRVNEGYKDVTRWRKTKPREWLISPKQALAVMLGSMALFNAVGNHTAIAGAASRVSQAIYQEFNPAPSRVRTTDHNVKKIEKVQNITALASTTDQVGSMSVSPNAIQQFMQVVSKDKNQGGNVVKLNITGNTSDEWGSDATIGVNTPQNAALGQQRAETALRQLKVDGLSLPSSDIILSEKEHVITQQEKSQLEAEVSKNGFSSIQAAITALDNGKKLKPGLSSILTRLFTGKLNRGVSLVATVDYPNKVHNKTIVSKDIVSSHDQLPQVPKPKWDWFIPMLPIRRREKYTKVKALKRWQFTPSLPIMRPEILREDSETAWLRLRPQAVNEDGTLKENSWAYTRQYENILKEQRIADVLRADFKNSDGIEKSLRIIFVDKNPSQVTIEAFTGLLKKFASMEGGKLADRISAIFVYPTENAGTEHGDPKRVAMGIDKQSSREILGTFTHALDLVELHMPTSWDTDELETLLKAFNGPAWVAAHEIAGHGTDKTDTSLKLRRVLARGIANAHVIDGDPRARKMSVLERTLQQLPLSTSQKHKPILYDIEYPILDNEDRIVTMKATVEEGDPRLSHASKSVIVGYRPTKYSGANVSEHYAETAASVTTGIVVPYEEAGTKIGTLTTDNGEAASFAKGYQPDVRGQEVFTKSIGAQLGTFPVAFDVSTDVNIYRISPEDDEILRKEIIRTSKLRTLTPEQMVAVLARIVRRVNA